MVCSYTSLNRRTCFTISFTYFHKRIVNLIISTKGTNAMQILCHLLKKQVLRSLFIVTEGKNKYFKDLWYICVSYLHCIKNILLTFYNTDTTFKLYEHVYCSNLFFFSFVMFQTNMFLLADCSAKSWRSLAHLMSLVSYNDEYFEICFLNICWHFQICKKSTICSAVDTRRNNISLLSSF